MNYLVEYYNDFTEPYQYQKKGNLCRHINSDQYIVQSIEDVKEVIKDFLDIPTAELSLEEIMKDFSSEKYPLSEEKAVAIQNYYNGRLTIYEKLCADLEKYSLEENIALTYEIPQKYNEFVVTDDEEPSKQNRAFLRIQTSTISI